MRKVFLTLGTLATLFTTSGSALAFNEYYAVPAHDARRGVHPYDLRKEALERRQERSKRDHSIHYRGNYYGSYLDYYIAPERTENIQLHPRFRENPAAKCTNYSFTRVGYRGIPKNYNCY